MRSAALALVEGMHDKLEPAESYHTTMVLSSTVNKYQTATRLAPLIKSIHHHLKSCGSDTTVKMNKL